MQKREYSESESSWSSVEEIETKAITETRNNGDDDLTTRSMDEPRAKAPRRKSRSNAGNHEVPEVPEDREETAQLRPLLAPSS